MEALKAWNGHNRIGSIFNSRASPNQQGLIHPFCWVPMFFGISFSESFRFWPSEGTSKTPPRGTWTWAAWEDAPPAALSLVLLSRQPQVSLMCRLGNFLLRKLAHQIVYAPPAQHCEPVFAVEVKGSLAPGAPMKWSLCNNLPGGKDILPCPAFNEEPNALLRNDNSSLCLFRIAEQHFALSLSRFRRFRAHNALFHSLSAS